MKPSFVDSSFIQIETDLAEPTKELVEAMRRLEGDLLVLGAAGKMGPSLCRLACRASEEAGTTRTIWAASRFSDDTVRQSLETAGVSTIRADLLEVDALTSLPECPNVVLMAGHKFGSSIKPEVTWATNVLLPALAASRFAASRIVAFSTGNVYPLTPVSVGGSTEDDPLAPAGEYAVTALGRERVLTYLATSRSTPMALLRLARRRRAGHVSGHSLQFMTLL
jgi:dTDP-4-dehydrorhamnose reductase